MSNNEDACCEQSVEGATISNVESVLSIDDRGQLVLPKNLRKRACIEPGDKLVVISHEKDGEVCCITLIKAESLNELVKGVLGSVMKDITTE